MREVNATQLSQVKAVVMEATGDVSVLSTLAEIDYKNRRLAPIKDIFSILSDEHTKQPGKALQK